MIKGWRDGEGVIEVDDAEHVVLIARADGIVAVGGKVPPMIRIFVLGWEGVAPSVGLGARGRWRRPGRQRGLLRRRAIREGVVAVEA